MHYNLSPLNLDAVLDLTHRMGAVPTAYREYYSWKLFLRKADQAPTAAPLLPAPGGHSRMAMVRVPT